MSFQIEQVTVVARKCGLFPEQQARRAGFHRDAAQAATVGRSRSVVITPVLQARRVRTAPKIS